MFNGNHGDVEPVLSYVKKTQEHLLDEAMKYTLWVSVPILVLNTFYLLSLEAYLSAFIQIFPFFFLLTIYLLRSRLRFRAKIGVFGANIVAFGICIFANFGRFSLTPLFFLAAAILITTLIGGRRAYVFAALCFLLLAGLSLLDWIGLFEVVRLESSANGASLTEWFYYIIVSSYVILAAVLGLDRIHRVLTDVIRILEVRNREMADMVEELSSAQTDLMQRCEEVTQSREKLSEKEEQYRKLVETSKDVIYSVDGRGRLTSVNAAFEKLVARPRSAAIGADVSLLLREDDLNLWKECFALAFRTRLPNELLMEYVSPQGEARIDHMVMVPILGRDAEVIAVTCTHHDMRDLVSKERKIQYLEFNDPLTGLANRTRFRERLGAILEECRGDDTACAVFFLDLDGFKMINDSMGHDVGDSLIKEMADRLRQIPGLDTLSRTGPDEFGFIVIGAGEEARLLDISATVQEVVSVPWRYRERLINLNACVGISIFPRDGETPQNLLQNADTAMNSAKRSDVGRVQFFNPSMKLELDERFLMEQHLRDAIANGEMEVYYQPQVEMVSQRVRGFEALLRWTSPFYGAVSPARFIPILEETMLIASFDEWVMRSACRQNRIWQQTCGVDTVISVNVSAVEFMRADFLEMINAVLQETELAPASLEIEITESIFIRDFDYVVSRLRALRAMGVKVALDDFGTGYSSLSYLRRLPIDTLKIDRAFVLDVQEHAGRKTILGSIIALAHDMEMAVVAEGVETEEQITYLTAGGCDYAQGYYYHRPMEARYVPAVLGACTG